MLTRYWRDGVTLTGHKIYSLPTFEWSHTEPILLTFKLTTKLALKANITFIVRKKAIRHVQLTYSSSIPVTLTVAPREHCARPCPADPVYSVARE